MNIGQGTNEHGGLVMKHAECLPLSLVVPHFFSPQAQTHVPAKPNRRPTSFWASFLVLELVHGRNQLPGKARAHSVRFSHISFPTRRMEKGSEVQDRLGDLEGCGSMAAGSAHGDETEVRGARVLWKRVSDILG